MKNKTSSWRIQIVFWPEIFEKNGPSDRWVWWKNILKSNKFDKIDANIPAE